MESDSNLVILFFLRKFNATLKKLFVVFLFFISALKYKEANSRGFKPMHSLFKKNGGLFRDGHSMVTSPRKAIRKSTIFF